jgi:hypothetical protein
MADPADPVGTNPCPVCGFLNTPERVYCTDCGAKLGIAPPSYLKTPPPVAPAPAIPAGKAPAATPTPSPSPAKKPRILSTHRGPSVVDRLKAGLRLVIYAGFVAVLVAIVWPPANVPAPVTPFTEQTVAEIRAGFARVADGGGPVDVAWPRLNAFLATVLQPGKSDGSASFVRAFLQPIPGGFSLTIQKRVLHIPIYTFVNYRLVVRNHRLAVEPTGGGIGRLSLPTTAAPVVKILSGDLGTALAPDLEVLRRAHVVRLSPEDVHLDFPAHRP